MLCFICEGVSVDYVLSVCVITAAKLVSPKGDNKAKQIRKKHKNNVRYLHFNWLKP